MVGLEFLDRRGSITQLSWHINLLGHFYSAVACKIIWVRVIIIIIE